RILLQDVGHDDAGALLREQLRLRLAHSVPGAGHDRYLVLQPHHFLPTLDRAARIARQIRYGVAGPSRSVTPNGASASRIALVIAGNAPTMPASPQPLTPSGLVAQRVGLKPRSKGTRSSARGSA